MPYPEFFVAPMRKELTDLGIKELRTPAEVDAAVTNTPGTVMIVVNSVCGCAAGKARPGVAMALRHDSRPDVIATVFAGADVEATDRRRRQSRCCAAARLSTCWSGCRSRGETRRRSRRISPRRSIASAARRLLRSRLGG